MAHFLLHYGYRIVFFWVLMEQSGVPVPAAPMLLSAGALAGTHRMNLGLVAAIAVAAVMVSDCLWYMMGRHYGTRVLRFLCSIALEPDSCVRQAQVKLGKHGSNVLLVAKFIPGVNTVASPLAGIVRMEWRRFLLFDFAGASLWVGVYTLTGYRLGSTLERIPWAAHPSAWLLAFPLVALMGYLGWKFYRRRRFLKSLAIARITAEDLKAMLDAGDPPFIVDLRHPLEFDEYPNTIPGALHLDATALEKGSALIPRDREIVLFCTCPNEATAARLALLLRARGIIRIRPLEGGYDGWRRRGFPLVRVESSGQAA